MKQTQSFFAGVIVLLVMAMFPAAQAQVPENRPPTREYVIGVNDTLDIQVWRSQEFSRRVMVRSDGKITMPLLGDIQAANLKVSMLKNNLEELLRKYLKQPRVTITVSSSKILRVTLSGAIARVLEPPRGITLSQILTQVIPALKQLQPPPNLTEIKVIGVEEEFEINALELLSGKAPQSNIHLEWGDDIFIPSIVIVAPVPEEIDTRPPEGPRRALFTLQEFDAFLQQFPEAQPLLESLAVQPDEETITIDLNALSEEQREELGPAVLEAVEPYLEGRPKSKFSTFTKIALAGINVNLTLEEQIEAFLALPFSETEPHPLTIKGFREKELVQPGLTEEENIYLEQILDVENKVILKQGDKKQQLELPQPFSQLRLSGILELSGGKTAFFSAPTNKDTSSKRAVKRRFKEGDTLEEGVEVAQISNEWVLLQKENATQLLFLRDARYHVPPPSIPSFPTAAPDGQVPGTAGPLAGDQAQTDMQISPQTLQGLNQLSKLFFATPLFNLP